MKKLLLSAALLVAVALGGYAANELTIGLSLNYARGFDTEYEQVSQTLDVDGTNRLGGSLIITNGTPTVLNLSTMGTAGMHAYFRNVSATSTVGIVRLGNGATNYLAQLAPGRIAVMALDTNIVVLVATAGVHAVKYDILPQ